MLKKVALLLTLLAAFQLISGQTPLHAQAARSHTRIPTQIYVTQLQPVEGSWGVQENVTIHGRIFDIAGTMDVDDGHVGKAVFDNRRRYEVFESWVGFRGSRGRGTNTFIVQGDGQELFRSEEMSQNDPPIKISLSIKGCRGVTLFAFGSKDVGYYNSAVWAEPILRMGKPVKSSSNTTATPPVSSTANTTGDTNSDAAPVKNKILQISPARMDELAAKLKAALAKDPIFSKSRPTLAIANFKLIPVNVLDPTNADNVREDLSTAIISTDTFNVVERGQLDQALKELKIGLNDTFDSATAQKLGKLVSAQVVLIGSISDRGSFVVINARLIDTATGRARAAANVEVR